MSDYRCKWCGKTIERDSDKAWIRSLCKTTGKTVHMMRCSSVTAPWTEAERDAAAQAIERHFYDGSSTEDYYDDDSGDEDRAIAAAVLDVVAPMIAERAIKQAADAAADNCASVLNDDDPTEANRWADTEHWLRTRAEAAGDD